ncbi:unnamed protein product [Callosobruchus maculatus]|uniref:Uncharacterized protein n=1 Tax=Callosobruchus maculatus TaxID=64391 RepID=A0A653D059_CALMS|nr:unnamed protein product [Callosobruchus maculatus]
MSKRFSNSKLENEDDVIKRQRKKEKFDKLQREMETFQRKIDLFSSDSSSVLLTRSIITLPWLWHIYQDGFSKEKQTRGSHTHTFSFSV